MTSRAGIEIDYCPKCRGVWLDRGELDKLLEREAQAMAARPRPDADFDQFERDLARRPAAGPSREPAYRPAPPQGYRRDDDDYEDRRRDGYGRRDYEEEGEGGWDHRRGPRRRKEGLFGEIFDIFGD
jgi:hypothetical protein